MGFVLRAAVEGRGGSGFRISPLHRFVKLIDQCCEFRCGYIALGDQGQQPCTQLAQRFVRRITDLR